MKLIVGLGNVGTEYKNTRHNLGFMLLDALAKQHEATWSSQDKFFADTANFQLHAEADATSEKILLAKPTTMMNRSGKAVAALANYYNVMLDDIWVVSDDLDLEFGKLRLRIGGSSGGQNGLKSIIELMGDGFVRLRVGIKTPRLARMDAAAFVLENLAEEEDKQLPEIIQAGLELISEALADGPAHTSTYISH